LGGAAAPPYRNDNKVANGEIRPPFFFARKMVLLWAAFAKFIPP
jgi:hypothetical protein